MFVHLLLVEDILIEHPSISVFCPRPAPTGDLCDSPMTVSSSSSSSATPIPSSPAPAVEVVEVIQAPVLPKAVVTVIPTALAKEQVQLPVRARKLRRPQLHREPLQEVMASNCLVQLVPKRSERKVRKQSRKEAKECAKRATGEGVRKPTAQPSTEASVHAGT